MARPKRVAITGAGGAIGYSAIFRILSGALFGPNQPVELRLLELPGAPVDALGKALFMEIHDCANPLLHNVVCTSDPFIAFEGADLALLFGARPRSKGMKRGDLLRANARVFREQGTALGAVASPDVRVAVIGNPANTNALICARHACTGRGVVNPQNITAMTRLDHNRGVALIAERARAVSTGAVEGFAVWGNHSDTMVPDVSHCTVSGCPVAEAVRDDAWLEKTFVSCLRGRGAAVIEARGKSSAASAASAAIDHARDWMLGTDERQTSMAVCSDGSYGVNSGLYCSFPVTCQRGGRFKIVPGRCLRAEAQRALDASRNELLKERDIAFAEIGF